MTLPAARIRSERFDALERLDVAVDDVPEVTNADPVHEVLVEQTGRSVTAEAPHYA